MWRHWTENMLCEIREGKAYLSRVHGAKPACAGACHSCSEFLGVDLWDTGKDQYRACCAAVSSNNNQLDLLNKIAA
jgi:hypothetical protein